MIENYGWKWSLLTSLDTTATAVDALTANNNDVNLVDTDELNILHDYQMVVSFFNTASTFDLKQNVSEYYFVAIEICCLNWNLAFSSNKTS